MSEPVGKLAALVPAVSALQVLLARSADVHDGDGRGTASVAVVLPSKSCGASLLPTREKEWG